MGEKTFDIELSDREIAEIAHCLTYALGSNHGTDGHLKANAIAKLALRLHIVADADTQVWEELDHSYFVDEVKIINGGNE